MTVFNKTRSALAGLALLAPVAGAALPVAAQDANEVVITSEHVAGNIHVLFGQGGNIGVSVGEEGVFLIDDQFANLTDKIVAKIKTLSDKPIRFMINTHFHYDHTGGNENLGKAGTVIVAHDNVRQRMSKEAVVKAFNSTLPPAPNAALPVITFDSELSLHLNGEETRAVHVEHAHTDGDSLIVFKQSNVIHMGDTFFVGIFPFIDTSNGGSVAGVLAAAEKAMEIADDNTRIIPGHGPLSDKAGLKTYHTMLSTVVERVKAAKAEGVSVEDLDADAILGDLNYAEVNDWARRFLGIVYNDV